MKGAAFHSRESLDLILSRMQPDLQQTKFIGLQRMLLLSNLAKNNLHLCISEIH
jgi:hypothetical protein